MNNFSHDSTEFVRITEFSVEEKYLAKSGGIGQLSLQTSSKDGRLHFGYRWFSLTAAWNCVICSGDRCSTLACVRCHTRLLYNLTTVVANQNVLLV